jgi:hypothetical protein
MLHRIGRVGFLTIILVLLTPTYSSEYIIQGDIGYRKVLCCGLVSPIVISLSCCKNERRALRRWVRAGRYDGSRWRGWREFSDLHLCADDLWCGASFPRHRLYVHLPELTFSAASQ